MLKRAQQFGGVSDDPPFYFALSTAQALRLGFLIYMICPYVFAQIQNISGCLLGRNCRFGVWI
jgi:hypothetical protein